MKKEMKFTHPRLLLSTERKDTPVLPEAGDEIYCTAYFISTLPHFWNG